MRPLDLTLWLISPTTYWSKKNKNKKEKIAMINMNWDKNEMKHEIMNVKVEF